MITVLAICIAAPLIILSVSAAAVMLAPIPRDPWVEPSPSADGEYVTVSDGAGLFVRRWVPATAAKQIVLGLHGLGQHSGYHRLLGESLAASGIAYYAADLRGNGMTRTPHGDIPGQSRIYTDIAELAEHLKERNPGAHLYVLGHSLGAALAASWAAETRPAVDGLILLAPAMTATAASVGPPGRPHRL